MADPGRSSPAGDDAPPSDPNQSPEWLSYLMPGTTVLRTVAALTDPAAVAIFERIVSADAEAKLHQDTDRVRSLDLAHVDDIHARLFGEVYPFAGQHRYVDTQKARPNRGTVPPPPLDQHLHRGRHRPATRRRQPRRSDRPRPMSRPRRLLPSRTAPLTPLPRGERTDDQGVAGRPRRRSRTPWTGHAAATTATTPSPPRSRTATTSPPEHC